MQFSYPQSTPVALIAPWFGGGMCPFRLAGDFCLVASTPWLLYRLQKHGATGVSVETQILRLLVFVSRYLDIFDYISAYNTAMKTTLLATSFYAIVALIFHHRAYTFANFQDGIYRFSLPIVFVMLMAPFFTYAKTFREISWSFSQFLGIVADIPQLVLLLNPENHDWRLDAYVGLVAGYRAYYIPHWIVRYHTYGIFDSIAGFSGVSSTMIFMVASLVILWRRHRHAGSKAVNSPEEGGVKITSDVKILN